MCLFVYVCIYCLIEFHWFLLNFAGVSQRERKIKNMKRVSGKKDLGGVG